MAIRIRSAGDHDQRAATIADLAARIASEEGWAAVTMRRLALEIGYSQPILYRHYPAGREQIVERVAQHGFLLLASELRASASRSESADRIRRLAGRYLTFAQAHAALYEAMFERPTTARFAQSDTAPELRHTFELIVEAIGPDGDPVRAEVLWAALHGLVALERTGRLPAAGREDRLDRIAEAFSRASEQDGTGQLLR